MSRHRLAEGASQTTGNFITGRSSTRVCHPPGGASSLSLGWDCENSSGRTSGARPRSASQVSASACWQDCGSTAAVSTVRTQVSHGSAALCPGPSAHQPQGPRVNHCSGADSDVEAYCGNGALPQHPGSADSQVVVDGVCDCELLNDATRTVERIQDVGHTFAAADARCEEAVVETVSQQQAPVLMGSAACGSRARASSSTFACGGRQNCSSFSLGWDHQNYDNVLTDAPIARRCAPPGGASSFSLGWDHQHSQGLSYERDAVKSRTLKAHAEARAAGRPSVGRSSSVTCSSVMSTPVVDVSSEAHATPRPRVKLEVEGSRPKVWKPSISLRAPPGGNTSFSHDSTSEVSSRSGGRRLIAEAGAGCSNDGNAIEALRFYRNGGRLGKQQIQEVHPLAEQGARDTHRYFLAADGPAARTPGKAQYRLPGQREGPSPIFEPMPRSARCGPPSWAGVASQSTYADTAEALQQQSGCEPHRVDTLLAGGRGLSAGEEFDSLPLGAEWCTWEPSDCGVALEPFAARRAAAQRT